MSRTPAKQLFVEVRELLQSNDDWTTHHWTNMGRYGRPTRCYHQAIKDASRKTGIPEEIGVNIALATLPPQSRRLTLSGWKEVPWESIVAFNDSERTSWRDVDRAIKRALEAA